MNKTKGKGRLTSLITGSSGKPKKVEVGKRLECKHCGASLEKGDMCFAIPKPGSGGFGTKWRYCFLCFGTILDITSRDLEQMRNELDEDGSIKDRE